MKTNTFFITKMVTYCAYTILMLSSCTDDTGTHDVNRLFRPIASLSTYTSGDRAIIQIEVENEVPNKKEYQFELFKEAIDETSETAPLAVGISDKNEYEFGINEYLAWETTYYARIKAISDDSESKYYICGSVQTNDFPTKLTDVANSEITDTQCLLRWEAGEETYTVLDVTDSKDNILFRHDISTAQGSFIIENLKPSTTYKLKVYVGEMPPAPTEGEPFANMPDETYRGKKVITTKEEQHYDNPVMDLTKEEITDITTDFLDRLDDNTVVILKAGTVYKINKPIFSKSVKFVSEYSLKGYANMIIGGSGVSNSAKVENIEFENINLSYTESGKYIFELGTSNVSVGTIKFTGCNIGGSLGYRGCIKIKVSDVTIDNLIVNNCILNGLGDNGIIGIDKAATTTVKSITISASTLYSSEYCVRLNINGCIEKLNINESTFYNTPKDGKYLFDVSVSTIPTEATVTKCIFSKSQGSTAKIWNGSNAPVSIDNYTTSDFKPESANQLTLNSYNGTSDDLFTNPAEANFKLKDSKLKGFGDPRWY